MLDAARVRQYAPILNIAGQLGDKEIPKLSYHQKCRSIFTTKRDPNNLKRKASEREVNNDEVYSKCLCKRVSSEARVYAAICIFCSKDKFQKGTRTREKLTQAVQLRADQTLHNCAIRKGDEKIIAVTSREIVAAEAHYHRLCYRNYTRAKSEHEGGDSSNLYQKIEKESHARLFEYIRTDIFPSKKIVPIASLTAKLESFMLASGIEQMHDSTKKHIHRKLVSEFEGSVQIFPDDEGKLLMVPDTMTLRDVVVENQILERELAIWNYARYLSAYYAQMTTVPEMYPCVYEAFNSGQFSVQISSNNPFGRVPVDQTIETTVNKDTQTPGGTSEFSLKAGAIKRCYITAEHRSGFLGQLRGMVQGRTSGVHHAELQPSRMKKDEEAVSAVVDLIQRWINPFSKKQGLINISTARTAPTDISCDLMRAHEIGGQCYVVFKEERLEKDPPKKLP